MFRQARFALITTALAVSAMVAGAAPARAQQASGSLGQAIATAGSTDTSSFLVTGIATSAAEGQQSSSGGARAEGFGVGAKIGPLFTSYSQANKKFNSSSGFEGGIWFGGNRGGTVGVMGEILYAKKKQAPKKQPSDASAELEAQAAQEQARQQRPVRHQKRICDQHARGHVVRPEHADRFPRLHQ